MITQAITTNWAWAGSARLSSHTNGSCDHYPPPSLYQGLGPNLWGPGARFRPAPSLLNSQELLLDTDTPDWSASTTAGGGGGARPRLAAVYLHFQFPVSWHIKWILKPFFFFFKHQFKRRIFFSFPSLLGSKRDTLRYFITLMEILGDWHGTVWLVGPGASYRASIETGGSTRVAFHTAQQRILLSF